MGGVDSIHVQACHSLATVRQWMHVAMPCIIVETALVVTFHRVDHSLLLVLARWL
jgi:hypothetical protein